VLIRHLWQIKTVVSMHWFLICALALAWLREVFVGGAMTLSLSTFSVMTLSIMTLSIMTFSITINAFSTIPSIMAKCGMLNVIVLNVTNNNFMLSVVMLNTIMLSDVAPYWGFNYVLKHFSDVSQK
jgi:hypothetical protein